MQNITVDTVEPRAAPGGVTRRSFTVTFSDRCILCLRCVTQCPTEAIQIGKGSEGTVRWRGPLGTFDPRRAPVYPPCPVPESDEAATDRK